MAVVTFTVESHVVLSVSEGLFESEVVGEGLGKGVLLCAMGGGRMRQKMDRWPGLGYMKQAQPRRRGGTWLCAPIVDGGGCIIAAVPQVVSDAV